ncbi:hypothetical protein GCM10010082_24840 [Kushneria pakistanensis]|uniref:Sulfotransferase domain-containing protein n=1 Tax=Kushneria pakistanensis TaxID=1508770 RepID=A0ABQ3FMN0_9GAMM|nr:sulfotransferase [Kushneria pakistanensis]GHC29894.1 hypothetical protein GCM10010082_24840 [Kushneria pakistanensis]
MDKRKPDVYIVGSQKSGTTTLYDWLAQHSDIYGDELAKDFNFFSDSHTYNEGRDVFLDLNKKASESSLALGGDANAMFAERGPERMYEMMPDAKLIAILRDPVKRYYSAYTHAAERFIEKRSFNKAVREEIEGCNYSERDSLYCDYLSHGEYTHQIKKILKFYPESQLMILDFDDLVNQPLEVLKDVYRYIGVDDHGGVPNLAVKNNTKGGARFKILSDIARYRPSSYFVRAVGKKILPYNLRTSFRRRLEEANRVQKEKAEFDNESRQLLIEHYKNEGVEIRKLTGKNFKSWSV